MNAPRLVLFLGVAALASGCNCAGREFTLSHTFHVHATADEAVCTTVRDQINVGDDPSFVAVKQFVGHVELRKLSVTVTDPRTDPSSVAATGNGSVRVADAAGSAALTLGTYGSVPITLNSTKDIPLDAAAAKKLADLVLTPPNTFFIEAEGCSDVNPAFYDFRVDLTVYAGVF